MSEEVKLIAEVLWKFHNDRLEDPSIKEMKPYIEPILESNRQVLQRVLDARIEESKLWYKEWGNGDRQIGDGSWEDYYEHRIETLKKMEGK